jgi:hypothetical protein
MHTVASASAWRTAVVHGDKVQRETIYFGEPFPAPDWRKPWAEEGATWERQGDLPARLPDRS